MALTDYPQVFGTSKGLSGPTHPYNHAGKLYIPGNHALAPKQKYLYYVSINIGVGDQSGGDPGGFGNILNKITGGSGPTSLSLLDQYAAGALVKSVELPKFAINNKTLNAYNKKNVIQTGIVYEPVAITFHDDAADTVTRLWNDYYTHYYRDSDYDYISYQQDHVGMGPYQLRRDQRWGYTPRNKSTEPFLRNIQIFSLHNKKFTEYLLINPYIISWRHNTMDNSDGAGLLDGTMTVAYETVKYRTGSINAVDVNGFGVLNYDNTTSPIHSMGLGSLVNSALGSLSGGDLARPDGVDKSPTLFDQIGGGLKALNALGGINAAGVAVPLLGKFGAGVLSGAAAGITLPKPADIAGGVKNGVGSIGDKISEWKAGSGVGASTITGPSSVASSSIASPHTVSGYGSSTGVANGQYASVSVSGSSPSRAGAFGKFY